MISNNIYKKDSMTLISVYVDDYFDLGLELLWYSQYNVLSMYFHFFHDTYITLSITLTQVGFQWFKMYIHQW